MYLIVGLGNPGPKYLTTRHNIGFMVIDAINHHYCGGSYKEEHKALTSKWRIDSEQALLVKPQTYMNLSGESVRALMDYYNIEIENLLVIHDEVNFPYPTMKLQKNRSPGGNNGIKSIHQHLDTNEYARLRLGVGRPSNPAMDVADYVLQNFSKAEQKTLPDFIAKSAECVETFILDGYEKAATRFNGKDL